MIKVYPSTVPVNSAALSPIFDHILTGGGQEASQVRPIVPGGSSTSWGRQDGAGRGAQSNHGQGHPACLTPLPTPCPNAPPYLPPYLPTTMTGDHHQRQGGAL